MFIKDARKIWTHGTYYTLDERITNDIYARLQELAEISADIIQRLEVPVLSAAPTTSTSTYDNGAKTFVVDQLCKVADTNGYYTYYRLHSIVNNTYNWRLSGEGGGSGDFRGTIKVNLITLIRNTFGTEPSVVSNTDLDGAVVSITNITDNGTPITKIWNQSDGQLVFDKLTPLKNYSISVSAGTS